MPPPWSVITGRFACKTYSFISIIARSHAKSLTEAAPSLRAARRHVRYATIVVFIGSETTHHMYIYLCRISFGDVDTIVAKV